MPSKGLNTTKGIDMKAMSIDDLLSLREQISEVLASRIKAEQQELESRLARLKAVAKPEPDSGNRRTTALKGRKLAPKYRNPDNPSETWAGRGRIPRWMAAGLKAGKKMADFRIDNNGSAPVRGRRKRT